MSCTTWTHDRQTTQRYYYGSRKIEIRVISFYRCKITTGYRFYMRDSLQRNVKYEIEGGGNQNIEANMDEKESKIVSLNEVVVKKDIVIATIEAYKEDLKSKWSKENTKLIGKYPLCGAKHILYAQLSTENTKFRECLNFLEEEHALALSTNQIIMQKIERRIKT